MEKITSAIALILGAIMTIYGLYYLLIGLNFKRKYPAYKETNKRNKFAILIAARNEEAVIGQLIKSLQALNYPKTHYDIYVLPNNCTDKTKEVAEKAGAKIYEVPLPVKSKGEVLNQTIDYLLKNEGHDAYLVFDADNLVDENFILEMNKALEAGHHAAMGFRDSKNPTTNAISGSYSIFYWLYSVFYNRARRNIGMSCLISGTGFMVSRDLMQRLGGWKTVTITEDVEMTVKIALANEHVEFVENAIIYDEQPENQKQAWNQRLRWSIGSQQAFRLFHKDLLRAIIKREGKNSLDMYVMLLATFMQVFSVIAGGFGLLATFFLDFNYFIILLFWGGLSIFLSQTLVPLAVVIHLRKAVRPMIKGILYFWFFILSWFPLHVIALFKDNIEWKEINHKTSNHK